MGFFRKPDTGDGSHPFRFNQQVPTADVELLKDIYEEGVQLNGDPIIYIEAGYNKIESTFGEHLIHSLKHAHEFYGFIEQTESWEGMGDMFSKFGLRNQEEMTISIPKNTFYDLGFAPKIGDLIFHKVSKKLWEVEHPRDDQDSSFRPLGQYIAFVLTCKSYRFDHAEASEEFATSENEHIQTIHEVLFGDGEKFDNAVVSDIEEKNEKFEKQIKTAKIIDNSETDPLGFS